MVSLKEVRFSACCLNFSEQGACFGIPKTCFDMYVVCIQNGGTVHLPVGEAESKGVHLLDVISASIDPQMLLIGTSVNIL